MRNGSDRARIRCGAPSPPAPSRPPSKAPQRNAGLRFVWMLGHAGHIPTIESDQTGERERCECVGFDSMPALEVARGGRSGRSSRPGCSYAPTIETTASANARTAARSGLTLGRIAFAHQWARLDSLTHASY